MTNERRWFDVEYARRMPRFSSWSTMEQDRIINHEEILSLVEYVACEAERRGYERAMEEVKEAIIPTAGSLTLYNRQGQEETIDVYYMPKSFFEKV